jgi:hypothetical protein
LAIAGHLYTDCLLRDSQDDEMTDPFDTNANDIDTPIWVPPPRELEPKLFLDGDRFLTHIQKQYDFFDVLTYSNSRSIDAPLRRIRRLITNLPIPSRSGLRPKEVRVVPNNHAKVFFCFVEPETLSTVYVGSQNLTHGIQINLMYRVNYLINVSLLTYFNKLWNKALIP